MKLVVDSNIFISSLDPKDIFHSECLLVLQVAEEFGVPLLTKDKEMKDKAPAGVIVFQPNEVLM